MSSPVLAAVQPAPSVHAVNVGGAKRKKYKSAASIWWPLHVPAEIIAETMKLIRLIGISPLLALLLILAGISQNCTAGGKRAAAASDPNAGRVAVPDAAELAKMPGIETVLAHPILPQHRELYFDCIENSAGITGLRPQFAEFDLFPKAPHNDREFYLAEEAGWPFVVGYHGRSRMQPGRTVLVGLRGEASGFHKSAATASFLRLYQDLPAATLVTVDEYRYVDKATGGKKPLAPICHRGRYPDRYINTESPGFENDGGKRLLWRLTAHRNPVIIVSYSNATTPRNQLLDRRIRKGQQWDFKHIKDYKSFLGEYLLNTSFPEGVYPFIRGFIDMEGNYEVNKPFWDMLAYIKLEVERDPEKFFYSAARIDKYDAYAGHLAMIAALDLTGVEDADGVIRFTNDRQNVVLDLVTNPYEPFYRGTSGDIRKLTRMQVYTGKQIKRPRATHFQMGDWTVERVLTTTTFLESLKQVPLEISLARIQ